MRGKLKERKVYVWSHRTHPNKFHGLMAVGNCSSVPLIITTFLTRISRTWHTQFLTAHCSCPFIYLFIYFILFISFSPSFLLLYIYFSKLLFHQASNHTHMTLGQIKLGFKREYITWWALHDEEERAHCLHDFKICGLHLIGNYII
jgi:hypothetical protein